MTENKKTTAETALVEQETSTEITPMALIQMATSQSTIYGRMLRGSGRGQAAAASTARLGGLTSP